MGSNSKRSNSQEDIGQDSKKPRVIGRSSKIPLAVSESGHDDAISVEDESQEEQEVGVEEVGVDEEDEDDDEDFELLEDTQDITVSTMKKLAARDESLTDVEKKRLKSVEGGIDKWIRSHVASQYSAVNVVARQLANRTSPVVKRMMVQEAKGLFDFRDGLLQKSFKFRSSFRDVFLEVVDGHQLFDEVLAIMLHAGSSQLRDAFSALYDAGPDATLSLDDTFAEGIPGNAAVKEVGLYLRTLDGFDYYCGISRDIALRQRGHNGGKPGQQGNRKMKAALAGRSAADVVKSKRLVTFGKTRLSECPQPVLNCMETMVICAARLTTSVNSLQVNVIDTPPFVPPSRPKLNTDESAKGQILANVWEAMYRFRKEQMDDFAHGKYFRLGARQIPIGIDGIARAEKEARMLILPFIRESDVGQAWVQCNLHRTWAFEKNGEMVEESRYPALEDAKARFPIPLHAFFQGFDAAQHRRYLEQGYKNAAKGRYPDWASTLSGPNGYSIKQPELDGRKAGLIGHQGDSSFSKETLEETKRQAWALWKNLENGRG